MEPKLGKLAQTKLLPITVNQAAGLSPRPSEYNLLLYKSSSTLFSKLATEAIKKNFKSED